MLVENTGTCQGELERTVEQQIVQRTWGRIHALRVERIGERLIIHGRTSSYYVKQLALLAALEVLGPSNTATLDLDIQVGQAHARDRQVAPEFVASL
ncbi:MAG: hypothetical protein HY000_34895 [Planctomycetes bacterium]|nr:hypothetical protein [Planctomycetota bacterium]